MDRDLVDGVIDAVVSIDDAWSEVQEYSYPEKEFDSQVMAFLRDRRVRLAAAFLTLAVIETEEE